MTAVRANAGIGPKGVHIVCAESDVRSLERLQIRIAQTGYCHAYLVRSIASDRDRHNDSYKRVDVSGRDLAEIYCHRQVVKHARATRDRAA